MAKIPNTALKIVVVISASIVLIAGIGAGVYVHQQNIAQKDRELQQTKELKEYEQRQINERAKADRDCQRSQILCR